MSVFIIPYEYKYTGLCVYPHVYVWGQVFAYIYIYLYVCVYTFLFVSVCVCVCVCACVCLHIPLERDPKLKSF